MAVAERAAMEGGIAHAEPFMVTPEIIYRVILATDAYTTEIKKRNGLLVHRLPIIFCTSRIVEKLS